jgi:hypothetical protein
MGITQTTTITCDDCNENLGEGKSFFYFQVQPVGEVAPPFSNLLAFCAIDCLQKWSAKLPA